MSWLNAGKKAVPADETVKASLQGNIQGNTVKTVFLFC